MSFEIEEIKHQDGELNYLKVNAKESFSYIELFNEVNTNERLKKYPEETEMFLKCDNESLLMIKIEGEWQVNI